MSRSLRVGKVNFINTLPIFYPLESGAVQHDFSIVEDSPAVLNSMLAAGELDLGLVSSVEYARRFEAYWLLPGLSLSCTTQIGSVLLLSRLPLQELHGREVLLTPKSHTSVALLKLLLSRRFSVEPCYRVADYHSADCRWPERVAAVLAIGNDALRLRKEWGLKLVLDLGGAWNQWTGHSFVFALWAVRREAVAEGDGSIRRAFAALLEARDYGLRHLDEIAEVAGGCPWFSSSESFQYLRSIRYDLNADKLAGLRLFFDMLYESGEVKRRVPLNFLPDAREVEKRCDRGWG
ncbi:MAG: menaquinone biosynthetic enzyme MqnA/MqnD family protein [Syntrophobacteria bacterium]